MRILAFNYEYPPIGGGGGVVHRDISVELAKRHEVTVVTSGFEGLPAHEHRDGVDLYRVPVLMRKDLNWASPVSLLSYFPRSWQCGKKLLTRRRYDVINSHFAVPSAPSAALLARRFQIPHVLSVHGGDLYDPSKRMSPHRVPIVRSVVRWLLCRSDRVVAQSSNTAENARTYFRVDRPIDVIPLGIVRPQFGQATRAEMGIDKGRFVIITIGRLIARKALADLLQVMVQLNDPNDLLLIVGDGPKRAEWQATARQLGVADRVRFTGQVAERDKWRLLSVSDLYASTSLHEGFGLVFLEAMHCGLPVVTYDFGGHTDFLEDGKTGALVPAGKRNAFVAAVQELKGSIEARRRCAAYNREHVKKFYIERCAARYEELFEELIRDRKGMPGQNRSPNLTVETTSSGVSQT